MWLYAKKLNNKENMVRLTYGEALRKRKLPLRVGEKCETV